MPPTNWHAMCMQGVNYEQLPVTMHPDFKALYNKSTLVWREVWGGHPQRLGTSCSHHHC